MPPIRQIAMNFTIVIHQGICFIKGRMFPKSVFKSPSRSYFMVVLSCGRRKNVVWTSPERIRHRPAVSKFDTIFDDDDPHMPRNASSEDCSSTL